MNTICVEESAIREKARKMPIGYVSDCQAASTPNDKGEWCFELKAYADLANRYAKYSVSEADPYRSRISGCCDRADQY
jgi:hypothetical protein